MRLRSAFCALALLSSACAGNQSDESSPVRHVLYWEKWTDFEGEAMGRVVDGFNAKERQRAKDEPGYRPIEVEMVIVSSIENSGLWVLSMPSFRK